MSEENKEETKSNDKIEQPEPKVVEDPLQKEYNKLQKKMQQQEMQINLMMSQEAEFQQAQQAEQQRQEQAWTDSTRVLVSKQYLIDLYFVIFIGNEREGLYIINNLCDSITPFQGQEQIEGRMLVDKSLMSQLKYCHENKDVDGMYVTINEMFYKMSNG